LPVIPRSIRTIALLAGALLVTAASPAPKGLSPASKPNWNATVTQQGNGAFTLGNPNAKVKLAEYVSYTCPHCVTFHKQADPVLRLTYVPQGKLSITVQQFLRNPVDVTVAMLTNCGDPKRFFTRHNAFMSTQDKWLGKMETFNDTQTARWTSGPIPGRLRAIASDFDFYSVMARSGYTRVQVDRCLADTATMKRLEGQTKAAIDLGVEGTPSFALDGTLLAGTHDWKSLAPQIDARL
jgi:protein-disulfide isomerase